MRCTWTGVAAAALLVGGCATPGSVISADAGALRTGIAAARLESQADFAAANKLIRDRSIDAKIAASTPILKQSDFPLAVPPEAAQQWSAAFDILDSYAAALQSLVDPKNAQGTSDAIGQLGASLNGSSLGAKIPAAVTGAVQAFGAALVQAQAERSATAVMRRTDAAFNQVVGQMAAAVGHSGRDDGTLYQNVEIAWNGSVLPGIEKRYGQLAPTDAAGRRSVISDYLAAMDSRDAQLTELGKLSQSLLALGRIHSAAANGRPGDAMFWIQRIGGWADSFKADVAAAGAKGEKQ